MCGVAAILSPTGRGVGRAIQGMADVIRHRGPDDEGFALFPAEGMGKLFGGPDTPNSVLTNLGTGMPRERLSVEHDFDARVALGHRRLSIVDLSPAGHQPMCDDEARYWIVYNGEIYNHLELRAELETLGRKFVSRSDTEVLLNAYAEWGPQCQERLNGMWAFLIYDTQRRTLFGSRDRFGIKPLYYTRLADGSLAFASEIKQFTVLPEWKARVQWQRAYEFLAWGLTDHLPETMFAGVRQLPPGCCFQVDAQDFKDQPLTVEQWYDLPKQSRGTRMEFSVAVEELRTRLDDAVRFRLRADVPVGSCLSGGLDSSSIVCLMHRQLATAEAAGNQQAVTSCSEYEKFDERGFVKQVVKQTGVRMHHVFPDYGAVLRDLPELTWHQDQPFGSTSIYAQWHVFAEAARQRLTVMLDGQGADEQLAGYHDFFGAWFTDLLLKFRWLKLRREASSTLRLHGYSKSYAAKQIARHLPMPSMLKTFVRRRFGGSLPLLRDGMRDAAFEAGGVLLKDATRLAYQDACTVRGKSLSQLSSTNMPSLLRYEDRNSMAHSIESRVPFLDHRVVEHSVSLPGQMKLFEGRTKEVLRRAMATVIPKEIAERVDKMGFVTPESIVFTTTEADSFRQALTDAANDLHEYFDANAVTAAFDSMKEGKRGYDASLWRLVSFHSWLRRFEVDI